MVSNLEINRVISNGHLNIVIQKGVDKYQSLSWFSNSGYISTSYYYESSQAALYATIKIRKIDKTTLHYLNGEKLVFPSLKIKEEVIFDYQNTKGEFHKYFIVKIDDKYNFYIIKYCGKVDLVLSSKNNVFNYDNTQFIIGETKCGN